MSDHPALRRVPCRVATLLLVVVAVSAATPSPCGAVRDGGAAPSSAAPAQRYSPPVVAQVIDPFRAPAGPYGPGNRRLEYATRAGDPVTAIGPGRVAFAGQVAGRLVVSIDHPDGLRSSVLGLLTISVRVGDQVVGGQMVGRSGVRLHLGVRRSGVHLDPATLFGDRGPARLVPLSRVLGFWPRAERR
jgi:murein DD-endopeptidase MepM/ murein hydrolase activator NlpD